MGLEIVTVDFVSTHNFLISLNFTLFQLAMG